MFRIKIWLQLLLLVLILRRLDAVSDQCSELQNEISRLEEHILKRITELEQKNEILVSQHYVTGLQYDILTCSTCHVISYYIVHVSSL